MVFRVRAGWWFAALVCAVGLGCGGGTQDVPPVDPPPVVNPVDPATAGRVTGRVAFEGQAPAAQPIKMSSDPNCAPHQANARTETIVVNAGALQNVFVYVKDGLGTLRFPVPSSPVVLDQQGCRYAPHVFGIQVGQTLEILNSDPTLHNVHAMAASNREFNMGQPQQGIRHTHTFTRPEVLLPFKCDVHGWMRAYAGVVDHPFHAVSAADGSFELSGLPPGTYTIEAVHETLGRRTQTVTVAERESTTIAFTFAAAST
jgi:plastocyanin